MTFQWDPRNMYVVRYKRLKGVVSNKIAMHEKNLDDLSSNVFLWVKNVKKTSSKRTLASLATKIAMHKDFLQMTFL